MDRIIATSAVTAGRIPYPWVEQADEGDTVLYPWGTAFHNGVQVLLTADGHGRAEGGWSIRLIHAAARSAQPVRPRQLPVQPDRHRDPPNRDHHGAKRGAVQALRVRGLDPPHRRAAVHGYDFDGDGTNELLLYRVPSDCIAAVHITADMVTTGKYPPRKLGPRRVWTEAEGPTAGG